MSAPQRIYRVGIAPLRSPKDFMEYKVVLALNVQEALSKTAQFTPDFMTVYEIRQVVLVDVVDIQ